MMLRILDTHLCTARKRRAMTIIELMAVMAIIAIIIALLVPAVSSLTKTAGRKGAVNILMNTLEQARAAALEKGCVVSVLLWRRDYPYSDSIMVVREPSPWNIDLNGAREENLIPLTNWIKLPEGVLLHKPSKGANIFDTKAADSLSQDQLKSLPFPRDESTTQLPTDDHLALIQFTPSGSISKPSKSAARIIISEGVRGNNGTEAIFASRKERQSSSKGGGFEIISLSRYTGRPRLDVTTLDTE